MAANAKILPVYFDKNSVVCRQLFVIQHQVNDEDAASTACPEKPAERTLVVYNVPGYCDAECLSRLFNGLQSDCVENVLLQPNASAGPPPPQQSGYFSQPPSSHWFQVAYVVVESPTALQRLLKMNFAAVPRQRRLLSSAEHDLRHNCGVNLWCSQYQYKHAVDPRQLQREIDDFMSGFDEGGKRNTHTIVTEPDEEGWQTVVGPRKRAAAAAASYVLPKYGQSTQSDQLANPMALSKRQKRKRKQAPENDFYRFQVKQSKMKHIEELRKKFEEDKKRIAMMKATRKFKPQ